MLERIDAPTFLIEHPVIHDAADRQLAVRCDGIVLEVFVAAVTVHEQPPVGIALANGLQQREVDGGAFDVERLVVLDDCHGTHRIECARRHVDRLAQHFESRASEELACLAGVIALAVQRQRKRLESTGRLSLIERQLVQAQQHRAAVDPARERHANGGTRILGYEPAAQLMVQRFDVMTPDHVRVRRQSAARRIEEARIDRVGIRAADQPQRRHMVGRRHACVRRMELIAPTVPLQLGGDRVDPFGDDEHRSVGGLRQEIAQRPLQAARQDDALTFLRDECKRAVDAEHGFGIGREQSLACAREVTGPQVLRLVRNQVDDLRDVAVHGRAARAARGAPTGRMRIASPPPGAMAMRRTELRVTVRCEIATGVGFVSQLAPGPSA